MAMESARESKALVAAGQRPLKSVAGMLVPRLIAAAGEKAAKRFLEFFAATIRNKNTTASLLPRRRAVMAARCCLTVGFSKSLPSGSIYAATWSGSISMA